MQPLHPDAIDTRTIFRVYAWIAIASGLLVYAWPSIVPVQLFKEAQLAGIPFGRTALVRIVGAVVAAAGCCAAAFARVEDPVGRRRGLYGFAVAHFVFGGMFFIQWFAVLDRVLPPIIGWAPLLTGTVLLYLAVTCTTTPRLRRGMVGLFDRDEATLDGAYVVRAKPEALDALRSEFEEQIRQVARQEERARLARDLHDAVKQQLFVIQTAAATAEARLGSDADGTKVAIEQVRASAREAMTEMEAMIEQLESTPMENTGLVEALKKQCEALGFRTGADVKLEIGVLPPDSTLPHGAQHALFRCAQEALANVGRHARARQVTVALGANARRLELMVRDDGAGFDPGASRSGMGIRNMASRVGVLGGTFALKSTPGRGTTVGCSIPYDATAPAEYRTKALVWSLVLAAMGVNLTFGDAWELPWSAAIAAIAVIAIARYVVAYYRVRGRPEATA